VENSQKVIIMWLDLPKFHNQQLKYLYRKIGSNEMHTNVQRNFCFEYTVSIKILKIEKNRLKMAVKE